MVEITIDLHENEITFLKAMALMSTKAMCIEGYDEPTIVQKSKEDVAVDMLCTAIRQAEAKLKECGVYRRVV
jgi:hypothetical protein